MSVADKRSVSTDALETLGTIIDDTQRRDAIHLAVDPRVAAEKLYPGQDVGLLPDGRASTHAAKKLGIVDPFLDRAVYPGETFWLVVYPRQIKSLRHVWTHPDFPDEPGVSSVETSSERWLRDFAVTADLTYEELMAAARDHVQTGEYLCDGGKWEGFYTPEEFWDHFENVTGEHVEVNDRGNFFSCSC